MPGFYNYIIYRLYSWRLSKNDETPATTVELILCLTHYAHLFTVYAILLATIPQVRDFNFKSWHLILIALIFQALFHVLIFKKEKWERFIALYSNESPEQRRKGTRIIFVYIFTSIILQFITLPLVLAFL